MTKWEDKKKRYDNEEIVSSERKMGFLNLSIHRHIHHPPDVWLATCYGIFGGIELKSKELSLAKCQATAMVQVKLENAIKDILGN